MVRLTIDNRPVDVPDGSTILDAARALGIDIPALCYRRGCDPNTSCLACVVKIGDSRRLVPACATRVAQGMVVHSETSEVREARKTALELLLADHAGDCLAPCQNVCPAHMDIPLMIRHIEAGHLHEALVVVKQRIALPAVLGRICPELCEKGCRRAAAGGAVSICQLKRHVADVDLFSGNPYLPPCRPDSGKRIAIVGTGPAGLAAAWYLRQMGHGCVLLDEHDQPGGNLRYAVKESQLPRDVLDGEIDLVRRLGATFELNRRLGRDMSVYELRRQFDAVLLAIGEVDGKTANLGLEIAGKSLKADRQTMQTAMEGVFAAGAALSPMRHAVRAVGDGRLAAEAMDAYLAGRPITVQRAEFSVRLGVLQGAEQAAFFAEADPAPRVAPHRPDGPGLSIPEARGEARRCMNCDCAKLENCALRHYAELYEASPTRFRMERRPFERVRTEQVVFESGKCISCGLCVQITQRSGEELGLTYIGRGFQVRVGAPLGRDLSEALRKVAAECAEACPTGAIVLRRGASGSADGGPGGP